MVIDADSKLYEYKTAPTPEALASLHRRKPDEQIINDGNEEIRARAIRLLANEPDYAEEAHARHRRGDVTKADAHWPLGQDAPVPICRPTCRRSSPRRMSGLRPIGATVRPRCRRDRAKGWQVKEEGEGGVERSCSRRPANAAFLNPR
jgi:hypothetical protein